MTIVYNFRKIEQEWQEYWDIHKSFVVDKDPHKVKYYVLEMLPYTSGQIHMGHVRNYTIGDVLARYKISKGFNVLHPLGWDSFGLPAENAAKEKQVHPADWTHQNIKNMKSELKKIGFAYDWSKEITTCDPSYYQQQQKLFLKFFENDLAYRKESLVNWDPVDQTVLANEQVIDGKGWRSGAQIIRKKLYQWFFRITNFADDLLEGLEHLPGWPNHIKLMQQKWIGKSEGCNIKLKIKDYRAVEYIEIFTTLPETIFGASFCAISFEYPLALRLADNNEEVKKFLEECQHLSTAEADIETREKKAIDTGLRVVHPVKKGETLPVYIANFVLMGYGTGAIFGCPAHDERDYEIASKYNLPIIKIVDTENSSLPAKINNKDILVNSEFLNGLEAHIAKKKIIKYFEEKKAGFAVTNFRLKDWGVSRQRYWGCPIPIIHCKTCGIVPVSEEDLPVLLPQDVEFNNDNTSLANHPTWKYVHCPKCNAKAERETDTLDTFVDSSWYFMRYCNPSTKDIIDKKACHYWLPVDQYIGGIEHAVLHLLYSRFFTKAMKKCGYIDFEEPFSHLLAQGMITHMSYKDSNNNWVDTTKVMKENGKLYHADTKSEIFACQVEKMSKSKKNTVSPNVIIEKYGADTVRLFALSDSPPEKDLEWTDAAVEGCYKFLSKLYDFVTNHTKQYDINIANYHEYNLTLVDLELLRNAHIALQKTSDFLEQLQFNKAIATIREFTNALWSFKRETKSNIAVTNEAIKILLHLLNPIAPHITEELWKILGNHKILAHSKWPVTDKKLIKPKEIVIVIQVNGKLKDTITVEPDASEENIKAIALENYKVKKTIEDKKIKKIIYIPYKVINIVI